MRRGVFTFCSFLFLPGLGLSWYVSSDVVSDPAPAAQVSTVTSEAMAAPVRVRIADGWHALPPRETGFDTTKVATASFAAPLPIAVEPPTAAQEPEKPAPAAPTAPHKRPATKKCHLAKAEPAPAAGGLLGHLSANDPVVPNKRPRNANCSAKRGG